MAVVAQLILASQSPFRRTLLASTGIQFEACSPPCDEYEVTGNDPAILAQKRAEAKALAAARVYPQSLVIGADQTLSCRGRMFDKARTPDEAFDRLRLLAGKTHYLHSGLSLAYNCAGEARLLAAHVENVAMPMRSLSREEIRAYVATGEWQGSVGCYQFENSGVNLFEGVDSDHSSIVGLPLQALLGLMRGLGVNPLLAPAPPWRLACS